MKKVHKLILPVLLLITTIVAAQPQVELRPVAGGFSSPLNIAHANDSRIFIVQQHGLIRIMDSVGNISPTPFLDLSDSVSQTGGERGLLGLAFHPEYHTNGYFYVNYTGKSDGTTVISRYTVSAGDPNKADIASGEIVLTQDQPYTNHNGGDLKFGPDGYLYIAMGDGGNGGDPQNYAQNRKSLLGKILRIDIDNSSPYSIPPDNPFVNDTSALDEIWALGLRNPWRTSFDKLTGDYWIADVGQNAWEEVNFQPATSTGGVNYGWRCYEGNATYNTAGCGTASMYEFPVMVYAHQGSNCGGSITGGYVYRGALYNGLYGKYLAADFCKGDLYWVEQHDTGFASGKIGTYKAFEYSSFGEDNYGELYITLLSSGAVQKVADTSDCRPVALIAGDSIKSVTTGDSIMLTALYHPTLQYQWSRNGTEIPGADQHFYYVRQAGSYSVKVTNPINGCNNTSALVEVTQILSISEDITTANILLYPNPATNEITLEGLPIHSKTDVSIINMAGQTLKFFTVPGREKFTINTTGVVSGIYFVKVTSGEYSIVKKLVITY